MSWDYTGTQQFQHNTDNLFKGLGDCVTDSVGDGAPPSLHLIYQTMMVQHKQTQGDNKKARVATKQLQVAVSKIAKSCSEIRERIAMIETRASVLEAELGTVTQQSAMHVTQFTDIQWKIEDFENRLQEGTEGEDPRAFIVRIFKTAFLDLAGRDWEKEMQRAHRFPLYLKKQRAVGEAAVNQPQARAIIVYFGNYLLRQAIFEKASPDLKINWRCHRACGGKRRLGDPAPPGGCVWFEQWPGVGVGRGTERRAQSAEEDLVLSAPGSGICWGPSPEICGGGGRAAGPRPSWASLSGSGGRGHLGEKEEPGARGVVSAVAGAQVAGTAVGAMEEGPHRSEGNCSD
ncbi:hypothetical protein NDU88_009918 [Pleurodeles waltl]|uniref:Uncharacterized protein n=1 Tax=Pleurodeles waltl TaxID=8319 RepID=A0AAV7PYJ1_PLEWA|nr:hypothetical protein NDU88_009918 [Pleurodeles waltl]